MKDSRADAQGLDVFLIGSGALNGKKGTFCTESIKLPFCGTTIIKETKENCLIEFVVL